jgi:hypothetical protein
MSLFQLPHNGRANVWLDEPPPANFDASSTVTQVVRPKIAVAATRTIAALEINLPHGSKASYALLGAELVDSEVEGVDVVVSVNSTGFPFAQSLSRRPEEVKVGLLKEYASAVISGVENVSRSHGLPQGVALKFRWGAHGLIGSSPWIFEKVSGLVARLLTLPTAASKEELNALLVEGTVTREIV